MAWTNDQKRAINTRGGKVLVSAAAGSGKTAVLSERVLDFVSSGNDIDKLLVVTFTEAAALEMKTRIKSKIEEKVLEEKDNKHLVRQLTLIDSAKITTMDSFYSEIVKQNFDKLGIMPDFSILSGAEEEIIKNKVIKELLEDSFNNNDFIYLLDSFNDKTTNLIKDKIIKVANFLDTIPFAHEYIKDSIEKYSSSYYKDLLISEIKNNIKSYQNIYEDIKEELYNASSDFDKLDNNIYEETTIINKLLEAGNINEMSSIIRLAKFSTQARITGHKDDYVFEKYKVIRKKFKDYITKKLLFLVSISDEEFDRQVGESKKVLSLLFDVVLDYKNRLLDEKRKINKYTFGDIPHFVISLLIKDNKKSQLAKNISLMFDEILIDEYQDTNMLQDIIFNAISKDETNLFVVGDIKQSIYKFRSACPKIFNDGKNNAYKDKFPMLITLSKNFRSRNLVLDFSNFIFENIMSDYLGEVVYNSEEKLYTGASFPDNMNAISEIDIIDVVKNKEEVKNEEEEELSNAAKEASYVANRVKELIDTKYQVYDKNGYYRDIKPSDIAILSRSLTNSDLYINALKNKGIGVYTNKDIVFFDNYDVKLIIAILKIIDNPYDDISLMTVIKSNLYNIEDNDIALLRIKNKNISLYDLLKTSDNSNIIKFIEDFNDIRCYAVNKKIVDIINYVYKKLDVINIIGTDKNKVKNLTLMIKNANDFEDSTPRSLYEFVSYIEEILLDESSFSGTNPLSDGDNVLMTTIHRSKGLEFPVVIVCNTGKKFNDMDFRSDILIDDNYGVGLDLINKDKMYTYETISKMVIKKQMKRLMLSEELRVLYVALTRAREKLIITGYINNLESNLKSASYFIGDDVGINTMYLEDSNNYLKWILACLIRHKSGSKLREYGNISCKTFMHDSVFDVNIIDSNTIKEDTNIVSDNSNIEEDIIINNYDYTLSDKPIKLSVSDLKKEQASYLRKPYFINSDVKSTNLGTLYHKVFELLPVRKYTISSLKEELNNINITSDERKLINLEKIFSYLTSSLYDMILDSDKVLKEYPITFDAPYNNNLVMVDGIIDLLCINGDTYNIIDYKTDKVSDINELIDRYKMQLDLYEIGVRNIFNAKNINKYIYSIELNKYIKL